MAKWLDTTMVDAMQYEGAHFYKCALQVNSHDYGERYQGQSGLGETTYNKKILKQCDANKIKIVGLADHGRIESSETLRETLEKGGIVVFPGFEIASSEKIHMVCLYPEQTTVGVLNQNLGQLMGGNSEHLKENPTHPSSHSCQEIAKKVAEQGGFWYAAHMTGKNGLLRLDAGGSNYVHLWKKDDLVVAGQIPGSINDLDPKYKEIVENVEPNYKRKKAIAIINAKDVADPEDLSKSSAVCFIKMTEPTFLAFRKAFYDPDARVRLDLPEQPYSYIKSIQWKGAGFWRNSGLVFSRNLNTIIGGRGTGKSTLIESIRYALDLSPHGNKDHIKVIEMLQKNNLGSSEIVVTVSSKAQHGQTYIVSRRYGEPPVVRNEGGEISHLAPSQILPDIRVLGQNEILEIEKSQETRLELVNCFLPRSEKLNQTIESIRKRLASNRKKIVEARTDYEELDVSVRNEAIWEEQISQYKKSGIERKLKNARLIEREKVVQKNINQQIDVIEQWLNEYPTLFDLSFLDQTDMKQFPNKKSIAAARKILDTTRIKLDQMLKDVRVTVEEMKEQYQSVEASWVEKRNAIQDELNQAIAELPDQFGKSGRELGSKYQEIQKNLAQIEIYKKAHASRKFILDSLYSERRDLMEEYKKTAFDRFEATNRAACNLNKRLVGKLRVLVERKGDLSALQEFMQSIEGIGRSKVGWLDNVPAEELDLQQWVKWISTGDGDALLDAYKMKGLTKGTVERLLALNLNKQLELEEIELREVVKIELNTTHADETEQEHYVPLENLSTGQKCTAILNLLLLDRDDPLIIDQPEDNLDNAFIAERIVNEVREHKTNRQFLFATHNANIPVLGDAELIAVLGFKDNEAKIEYKGSIDKPKVSEQASNILEGGEAAFEMRKRKYGF